MPKIKYKKITKLWILDFVIKHRLCPFAQIPFEEKKILYVSYKKKKKDALVPFFFETVNQLIQSKKHETAIIICPNILQDFNEYWDFIGLLEEIAQELKLEGVIQIASFHPDYIFEGEKEVTAYTNRSPFPMIHILLEKNVEQAIKNFKGIENWPNRNKKLLKKIGLKKLKETWNEITGTKEFIS